MVGSSPLARGLQLNSASAPRRRRIIPARAGFTRHRPPRPGGAPDHPRSRGVYLNRRCSRSSSSGSSPLARGLHRVVIRPDSYSRIIPARAGFTSARWIHAALRPDHPRSRGVYLAGQVAARGRDGSSPLARGLRALDHLTVHPAIGSSPLARGLPRRRVGGGVLARIIPARAGFTPWASPSPPTPEDHPRSRGVYSAARLAELAHSGSSPLARGLRIIMDAETREWRIIPARAGFTGGRTAR